MSVIEKRAAQVLSSTDVGANTLELIIGQIKPRHAAAVAKLREVYTKCQAELVAALTEAAAVDAEVRRVSYRKPYNLPQSNGDGRNLEEVELAARGLANLGYAGHSLLKDLTLPDFANPAKLAWPLPQPSIGIQLAAFAASPPSPEDLAAGRAKEGRCMAEYYAKQAREREAAERAKEAEHAERLRADKVKKAAEAGWPGCGR